MDAIEYSPVSECVCVCVNQMNVHVVVQHKIQCSRSMYVHYVGVQPPTRVCWIVHGFIRGEGYIVRVEY